MELKTTEVKRTQCLNTMDIRNHLKAIGQAIIDDADEIALDACKLRGISICAEIRPLECATMVNYKFDRIADPRFKNEKCTENVKDGRTEKTQNSQ